MSTEKSSPQSGLYTDPLIARLGIEPPDASRCALLGAGKQGESITRNEVRLSDSDGDTRVCRAIFTETGDGQGDRNFVRGEIDDTCVCPIFNNNDCVVEIKCFRDGTFYVCAIVPNRDALRGLIADLREMNISVHLEQLLPFEQSSENYRTVELETSEVTQKQMEAIEAAVKAGYYERPRRTDLSDLSDRLGISESAVSQRLNGVESTLVREMASAVGQQNGR